MKTFDGYKKRNLTDKDYALLAGGGHKALDTLFSALSSDTTNAIKITVGGTQKSITTSTLKTSLGLGSNAYTSTAYLPLAGGTMTGALNFKNGTWNLMGDDAYIGDCNVAGMIGIKGANAATPGFALYNNSGTLLGKLYASNDTLNWSGGTIAATIFSGNATSAECLNNYTISNPNIQALKDNKVKWFAQINTSSGYAGNNYGFPVANHANGILYLGTHPGKYGHQLGFSSNGNIYHRYQDGSDFPETANGGSWSVLLTSTNYASTLDKRYYTETEADNRFVNVTGDTMTGLLTTTSGSSHSGIKVGNTYINAINGDLIFQNNSAIRFGGDSWDYNVWAGLKYIHSSKIIYLGLADNSAFTANSAQSGGKLYLPGITNIYTGNGTNLVWHAGNDGSGSGLDADMIDGYHATSLWRSDGGTWNPSANITMTPNSNNQEWSFDFRNKRSYTGSFFQIWDESKSTLLKVHADSGKVSAPYGFVGDLEGYSKFLLVHDVRGAIRTPNYFNSYRVTSWFNDTGTPSADWHSGIHMKGWTNGYTSWELCSYSSTGTANNYNLYFRSGNNTTWGSWKIILDSSNYTSYCATYNHTHTYNVNDSWLRKYNDDNYFKCYGNSRSMVFRTDGTTGYSDCGGYPFVFNYGGDSSAYRKMLISTGGDIWGSGIGWVSTIKSTADGALQRSGGTMSGKITSSFRSDTWINSVNNSVITLTDDNSTYGGWICGPTRNGRIAISSYSANDDNLYIGYAERGKTANAFTRFTSWNGANGNWTTAGSFYANSDIRYKTVKNYLNISVEMFAYLPIFNYIWNNKNDDIIHIGSSAQAVEQVIPELVTEDSIGFKSLDYSILGTIAGITACKELVKHEDELQKLKARILELENKLSNYEKC